MRLSAVFFIAPLFAVSFAIPFTAKIQDGGSSANRDALKKAIDQANEYIDKMESASDSAIQAAFGPNVNVADVKSCISKLKSGKIFFDGAEPDSRVGLAGTLENKHVIFGSSFFNHQTTAFQAGTVVHEASHALCGTVDWFDKTTCEPVKTTANAWNGYEDSSDFKTIQDKCGKNMHLNADSYRLLATKV